MKCDAFKTTDCDYRPRFCKAAELADRLGLPLDFVLAEAEAGNLCYVDLTPGTDFEERKRTGFPSTSPADCWYFNVDIAEQEIMHTAQLSNPPKYMVGVPGVVCPTCRRRGQEVEDE